MAVAAGSSTRFRESPGLPLDRLSGVGNGDIGGAGNGGRGPWILTLSIRGTLGIRLVPIRNALYATDAIKSRPGVSLMG